jgi:hypothetical protein
MSSSSPELDTGTTRRLVANDPFLAYTVVRHAREAEDQWLRHIFNLEVRSDPALANRYWSLLRSSRAPAQPVRG